MKNKLKSLLLALILAPLMVVFAACGGDPDNNSGGGGGEPAQVTYSLIVTPKLVDVPQYNQSTNTIALEYGTEFFFSAGSYDVKLVGSDGSSQVIEISWDSFDNTIGYVVTSDYNLYGGDPSPSGNYTMEFSYKSYKATINIVVSDTIVPIPSQIENEFEYNGSMVYISDVISDNINYFLVELDYDNSQLDVASVGNYKITLKLREPNYSAWADGTTENKVYNYTITPKPIEGPTVSETSFQYEEYYGSAIDHYLDIRFLGGNASLFEIDDSTDSTTQSQAGNYTTRVKLKNPNYVIAGTGTNYIDIEWEVKPIVLGLPTLKEETFGYKDILDEEEHRYKGVSQTNEIIYASGTEQHILIDDSSDGLTQTLSRTYKVVFNTQNANYVFTDGTLSKTLYWSIISKTVPLPTLLTLAMDYKHEWVEDENKYVGVEQTVEFDYHGLEELFYLYSGSLTATNAGEYEVALTLVDHYNYRLDGTTNYGDTYTYTISPMVLESPYLVDRYKYMEYKFTQIEQETGEPIIQSTRQTPTISGLSNRTKTLFNINNTGASEPNEETPYYATVSLKDEYKNNFKWSTTGTNEPLRLEYYITKISLDITSMPIKKILRAVGYVETPGYIGSEMYYAGFYEDERFMELYMADARLMIDYIIEGSTFPYAGKIGSYKTTAYIEYPKDYYKIIRTTNGETAIVDTDGSYEEEFEWQVTAHTVDYKNLQWNYGDLLYTGEKVQTPFLDGEIISSVGVDNLEKLTQLGMLAELGFKYTLYKYNEESGGYEIFEGDLKDKGKYAITAEPIYSYTAYTYDEDNGTSFVVDVTKDEHFIVLNCPPLYTEFEIGKEPIYLTTLMWENEQGFEYNNCPLTPALTNIDDKLTYKYTYYNESGEEIDVPSNAGRYKVKVEFIYDEESYQLLNLFVPTEIEYEIRKVELTADNIFLKQDTFVYSGEAIQPEFDITCLPFGVEFVGLSGIINMDEAGTHEVFVHLRVIDELNYTLSSEMIRLEWTILKKEIDCTGFDITGEESYEYDGTKKEYQIVNIPEYVKVNGIRYYKWDNGDWIETTDTKNVGRYKAELDYFIDTINYNPVNFTLTSKEFEITPYTVTLSELEWNYEAGAAEYVYDGEAKEVWLKQKPKFVEINYIYRDSEGNDLPKEEVINAGTYYTEAFLVYEATGNIEVIGDHLILEWTIEQKSIDMSGVKWQNTDELEYTGEAQNITLEYTTLPEGINSITYIYTRYNHYDNPVVENIIDAGGYLVEATVNYDSVNYKLINAPNLTQSVYIDTASLFFYEFEWDYDAENPYIYDGNPHRPQITNLPAGTWTTHSIAPQVEVGSYKLEVFIYGDNYDYEKETIWFSIEKITLDVANFKFSPSTFIYDGTPKTPQVTSIYDSNAYSVELASSGDQISFIDAGTYEIEYYIQVLDTEHYNYFHEVVTLSYSILPKEVSMAGARWVGEHTVDFIPYELLNGVKEYPHLIGTAEEINFVYRYYRLDEETKEYVECDKYMDGAATYKIEFYPEDCTNYIITDVVDVGVFHYTVNKIDFDWSLIGFDSYEKDAYGNELVVVGVNKNWQDTTDYFGPELSYTVDRYGTLTKDYYDSYINFNDEKQASLYIYDSQFKITILEGEYYHLEDGVYNVKFQIETGLENEYGYSINYNYSKKVFDINYRVISEWEPFIKLYVGDQIFYRYDPYCMEYLDISQLEIEANNYNQYAKLKLSVTYPSSTLFVTIGNSSSTHIPDEHGVVNLKIPFDGSSEITFRLSRKYHDPQEVTLKLIGLPEFSVNGTKVENDLHQQLAGETNEQGQLVIDFNTSEEVLDAYVDKTYKEMFESYDIYYADSEYGERTLVTLENSTLIVEGYDGEPFSGKYYLFFIHKSVAGKGLHDDYYTFKKVITVE